jgi:DNA polymerase elongation subunit (family B)
MIANRPRCLVLDIETRPMEAYVWGRRDVNIGLDMLKQDWEIMAWSAKWLGEKKVHYRDMRKYKTDFKILLPLRDLLDEADILITQNGQSFDSRKINARLIHYGMHPPSPYKHLDTYRIARKVGDFTSNSLEYLTDKLNTKYKKLKHGKFPGMSLWKECLQGNVKAWDEMKRYNINDTLCTEELYYKLKPWIPETMTRVFPQADVCRLCGPGVKVWHKGYETKRSGKYHKFQCQKCYAWTIGGKAQ